MNKLVCDSFSSKERERKGLAEEDERFPGSGILPSFWKQVCNKKTVIIHSKASVGVPVKNSCVVDVLSRNNRSERTATGVTKNTPASDK